MNFNILLFACVVSAFGCGLKFGEKVKPTDVVEFKSGSCLSDSNKVTKSFFKGQAQDEKVAGAIDCYANVIETFRDNVRGESAAYFTPEEIQGFLNKNFLKDSDFKLSAELVQEIMKIKAVIVGGTRFRVTHQELTKLSETLREVKGDIVAFNPVMPLVVGWEQIDTATIVNENSRLQSEFTEQGKVFTKKLVGLSKIFKFAHLNYKVEELYELIVQILKSNQTESKTVEKFEALKPLVVKAAEIFIQHEQILDQNSWPRLLTALGEGYMAYRRYDLLVNDQTKNTGFDQITLQKIVSEVYPPLAELINLKSSHNVSAVEIRYLLLEAKIVFTPLFLDKPDISKWIQKILDLQTYPQLMNLLWTHVLNNPIQRAQGQATNAFDATALHTVAFELGYLFRSQANVFRMYEHFRQKGIVANRDAIKEYFQLLLNPENKSVDELDRLYASEHQQMFDAPAIMVFDENNYLKISDPTNMAADSAYALSDLEKSNYARAGARLLIRSFSRDLNSALTVKEASKQDALDGWELARPIVVELDFIQPDNLTFISSRFREADLFISSSNGDNFGQFSEVHDIVLHIYSGQKRSDALRIDIVNACMPGTDPESYKPKDTMDEVCLIKHYQTATNGFQSLPKYVELLTTHPAEMPIQSLNILKATGHEQNIDMRVKFEDLDLYPHVIQYVEMLYFKFDANRDGILDSAEATLAFPTFRQTISDVLENLGFGSAISDPKRQEGVFVYLLTKGRGPERKATKEEQKKEMDEFWGIVNKPVNWNNKTDRLMMGKLFSFLAATLNKPPGQTPKP